MHTPLEIQGCTTLTPQASQISKRDPGLADSCIDLICHATIRTNTTSSSSSWMLTGVFVACMSTSMTLHFGQFIQKHLRLLLFEDENDIVYTFQIDKPKTQFRVIPRTFHRPAPWCYYPPPDHAPIAEWAHSLSLHYLMRFCHQQSATPTKDRKVTPSLPQVRGVVHANSNSKQPPSFQKTLRWVYVFLRQDIRVIKWSSLSVSEHPDAIQRSPTPLKPAKIAKAESQGAALVMWQLSRSDDPSKKLTTFQTLKETSLPEE
ncbi:hypothetical protein CSKR_100461 [Clonorchis sinensis]|uniref:Uncharacterized protein n=1 Tax=Clonorchis sinensis TaxID=79923 RepID=A0A419Q961_CLOSI|nr:hypothetical protein CSKR_100461 [Clonorchis sinensis]